MVFRRHNVLAGLALLLASSSLSATDRAEPVPQMQPAMFAKQEAILGKPSKLAAIAVRQGSVPAAVFGGEQADGNLRRRISDPVSDKPDVFGSTALPVAHTPLDPQWRRVRTSTLPAGGVWTPMLASLKKQDTLARIAVINQWVNRQLAFTDDRLVAGTADRWATAGESLTSRRGDCEDYAIAKMQLLRAAGIPATDLYLTIVKDLVRRADHAVLIVRFEGRFLVLDNGSDRVAETADIADYRPILTYSADKSWLHGYRRDVQFAGLSDGAYAAAR